MSRRPLFPALHPVLLTVLLPVLIPALLALGACGSSGTAPHVATLPPASGGATPPASPADGGASAGASDDGGAGRPVAPVGETDEQYAQYYNVYHHCLIGHGAKAGAQPAPVPGKPTLVVIDGPTPAPAVEACLHLLPLPAPELDAATNPDFHQDELAYVACMQRQGLYVTLLNDHNLDYTFADGHPVPDGSTQIDRGCKVTAFGGRS